MHMTDQYVMVTSWTGSVHPHNKYCGALCVGWAGVLLIASRTGSGVCQPVYSKKYIRKWSGPGYVWSRLGQNLTYVTLPKNMQYIITQDGP